VGWLPKPLRLALTLGLLVFAGLAAAWLGKVVFLKTPAKALAFQARDWILLTDLENKTGEQVFDGSLETAMTVGTTIPVCQCFPLSRMGNTETDAPSGRKIDGRSAGNRPRGNQRHSGLRDQQGRRQVSLDGKIVDPDKQTVFSLRLGPRQRSLAVWILEKVPGRSGILVDLEQRMALVQATTSSLEAKYTGSRTAPEYRRSA
jgi:hypothetical protein